jgi:hypothetical protein
VNWNGFIQTAWPQLSAGGRVPIPPGLLHPKWSGFEVPPLAEPVGQIADWVLSLTDGSRLHVHEFANGALVAHRDETDPKLGPIQAAWHWATESTSGKIVVVGTITAAIISGFASLLGCPKRRRR